MERKVLPVNPKQEASKDARLYAAVPYRAFKDRRLGKNEFAALIAACGFLSRGAQVTQVPQQWIADQMGVHHTLIHRHILRLEAFGYLVRLAPRSKDAAASITYGIVFDPENKPSRDDLPKKVADVQLIDADIEQLPKKEATIAQRVEYSALVAVWRRMVFDYQPNELEQRHWQELATLGATPAHLAEWYQPGRNLIGYYMSQARSCLGAG